MTGATSTRTSERRGTPTEVEVRALVTRIATSVLAETAHAAAGPGAQPEARGPDGHGLGGSEPQQCVAVGADHGGFALKERLAAWLREHGWTVRDCGTRGADAVDYPDYALAVALLVSSGVCASGVMVDGAGIGSCMVANKVPGVRAALCYDISSARNSREHNHANVLTLGARLVGEGLALEIVETWLATPWGAGRHAGRVAKITAIEERYLREAR
jgi:ribose 5-phosphate isomerase B